MGWLGNYGAIVIVGGVGSIALFSLLAIILRLAQKVLKQDHPNPVTDTKYRGVSSKRGELADRGE